LRALKTVLKEREGLKILLVPRHVDRIPEIEKTLHSLSLDYHKWTDQKGDKRKKILLVDQMGFLRTCYQLSNLAIVAGSFIPNVGGHNILEPLWYSTPSIFGPYMHAQPQFVHLIKQAKSGVQASLAELSTSVKELLENHSKRIAMGQNGRLIFDQASGGSELTLKLLTKLLANN
jgi:3-deoxy-D-manno-octulosonic-acid transferase